ncbi:MAG: 4-hydroxythreonine-4-phosphate dehydrogenase PdxA [Pseudomonadota bacterium]
MTGQTLLLTAGEPAGIGPDLCLQLADEDVVIVGDPRVLMERAERLSLAVPIDIVDADAPGVHEPGRLRVIAFPFPGAVVPGKLDTANARALLDGLRFAAEACLAEQYHGLVTAPLQKSVVNDAGIPFSGHTEFLAEVTAAAMPVMLLVADSLRVALATTHLPLSAVPAAITEQRLTQVLKVLDHDLRHRFGIAQPSIVVCGLNPHAGEGGHLGSEDDAVIRPVVEALSAAGMNLRGPLPADTAFTPSAGQHDAVLAMYHDQGLPVLKYAGFGHAVNVTLGLPVVRTSVDHGTALDIAGTGKADVGSLRAAVQLARVLA